jgi:hypothetical protein
MPGQLVALRGTDGTGVYRVATWSESTNTTVSIDTGGGANMDAIGSTASMYTVWPEDENTLIEAFYVAKLF